ncbi:MAG: OmpA family protein [Deltaproteobacteria bacterium]|nr:OmpA family protein [Deltaproteobacteria bacterium]
MAVDAVGCPLDRDGDGFADYRDTCPDVPGPGTVDGCPVKEAASPVRMKLNVEFDTNKADVKALYHDEIGKLAEIMKKYPKATVVLEGHTDSRGSDNYNLLLSQRRVDSVRNYLIYQFGIDGARIKATGYGETRPVADNATDQGRRANRRVEAEIEYKAK